MSRFSLSFKFGLLLVGFIVATGVLVGLFVDAGRRVGVELFELKDRALPSARRNSKAASPASTPTASESCPSGWPNCAVRSTRGSTFW
jgi:hypothetical protein